MEMADIFGRHPEGGDEFGILGFQFRKGVFDLLCSDPDRGEFRMVEPGGVVDQRRVPPLAHVRNDPVNGFFHVRFGADVAVQDLFGSYLVKIVQSDHNARASFILVSSSVIGAYLNL